MLASAPDRPENSQTAMWKKMKPMTPDLFKQFWEGGKKLSEQPMTDLKQTEYDEWLDMHGHAFYGRRTLDENKPKEHGIIRMLELDGNISEETRFEGKPNGLRRWITKDKVHIILYERGNKVGGFSFNYAFEEISRANEYDKLWGLKPETFARDTVKLMMFAPESDSDSEEKEPESVSKKPSTAKDAAESSQAQAAEVSNSDDTFEPMTTNKFNYF